MYEQFQGWTNTARYKCYLRKPLEVKLAEAQLGLIRSEVDRLDIADMGAAVSRP
jgi:hypothetical protein